jgi:superfamily I DNA/RNA helicase
MSEKDDFEVTDDQLDDDQYDILEEDISHPWIVTGCAGSGKSVIGMKLAQRIQGEGGSVIVIAYTTSLDSYMGAGLDNSGMQVHFYYKEWKSKGMPKADYLIVDEIQDFSKEEIEEFIKAARVSYFFFGDMAQSIYREKEGNPTISMEELSQMTRQEPMELTANYRLPQTIAKITQTYVGVGVHSFDSNIYRNSNSELPHIIRYESEQDQIDAVIRIVGSHRDVGILLPSNEKVRILNEVFKEKKIDCQCKYGVDGSDEREQENSLDFKVNIPKMMTYHSAKGLQFETVIIPFFEGAKDKYWRKVLYVAMTRTRCSLFVLYSDSRPPFPLSEAAPNLYSQKE